MSKVLNAAAGNEWQNILLGNPPTGAATITGRYGADRLPSDRVPGGGSAAHVYAPTDLDGLINLPAPGGSVTGTGTGPYALPGRRSGYFPSFDPNAYLNGTLPEHTNSGGQFNHPMYFNPFFPAGDNRLLPLPAYASLLWAGVNASPSSDLVRLCPTNFAADQPRPRSTGRRVLSMDLDRAGAAPYIYDPTGVSDPTARHTASPTTRRLARTVTAPRRPIRSCITSRPALASRRRRRRRASSTPTPGGRSCAGALTRMNLNRALAPYPANGVQPPDRQQFAQDIYTRLVAVTGMTATYNNGNPATRHSASSTTRSAGWPSCPPTSSITSTPTT